MSRIKTCPFCNSHPVVITDSGHISKVDDETFIPDWCEVYCEKCGVSIDGGSIDDTIRRWNKRSGK